MNLRTTLGYCALLCAMVATSCAHLPVTENAEVIPRKKNKFDFISGLGRSQPDLLCIQYWNNRIYARTGTGYYEIDPRKGLAMPVSAHWNVVGMTEAFGDQPWALMREQDGEYLLRAKMGKRWPSVKPPTDPDQVEDDFLDDEDEMEGEWTSVKHPIGSDQVVDCLLGDKRKVVVISKEKIYIWQKNNWSVIPVTEKNSWFYEEHADNRYLLVDDTVYITSDRGEWGGNLRKLSLKTGEMAPLKGFPSSMLPVSDIMRDKNGKIWITQGLSHLSSTVGEISTLDQGVVTSRFSIKTHASGEKKHSFPPTSFRAVVQGPGEGVYVLGDTSGISYFDGVKLLRITPEWNWHQYLMDLHVTEKGEYLIGTYDAGLIYFDTLPDYKVMKIIHFTTDPFR